MEYAVATATMEIPDLLIDREVEVMHDELKVRLSEQGIGYEEYLKVTERDEQKLHAEYREPAEHRVKVLLVLSAIADAEGIDPPDEAVAAELARARERYQENPKLLEYFESERGQAYLRSTLRRTQVVETLVERWLAAHPEVGALPHAEDAVPSPDAADPSSALITDAVTAQESSTV
jgi:trigger factor